MAAPHHLTTLGTHPVFTPTVVAELTKIEADLGGRAAIIGLLVLAPLSPDLRQLVGILGSPLGGGRQSISFAEACARANVLPGEVLGHLTAAAQLVGKIQAAQIAGRGIGAVVEDVMKKAAPYTGACGACRGTGSLPPQPTPADPNPGPSPCGTCNATGLLEYQPLLETQKVAIELAQLIPKSSGLQILNQQNNISKGGGSAGGSLFDRLQQLTDRVLYEGEERSGPPAVEAEIVPAEAPE